MKTGIDQIREERERQKNKGYSLNHDQQHTGRELLKAAVCILLFHLPGEHPMTTGHSWFRALPDWIQDLGNELSASYEEALRAAGAFCAAELDRQNRQGECQNLSDFDIDVLSLLTEVRDRVNAPCTVRFHSLESPVEHHQRPKGAWIQIRANLNGQNLSTGHQLADHDCLEELSNREKRERHAVLAIGGLNQRIHVYRGKGCGD